MRPLSFFMFALTAALAAGAGRAAAPQHFTSGPARVSLVELYTSEGCSSCPPAERWLGALRSDPGLWKEFVPVAFHVDYWNRLGWTDRFSTREFTQRQYTYAAAWAASSVYTPCFVRDGAEWHVQTRVATRDDAAGTLTGTYDGAVVRVEFSPAKGPAGSAGFEVHAAILGADIVSKVTAGENSGETLRHNFIALAVGDAPLGRDLPLAVPALAGVPRHAIAIWVTRRGELVPVQATGGWLAP